MSQSALSQLIRKMWFDVLGTLVVYRIRLRKSRSQYFRYFIVVTQAIPHRRSAHDWLWLGQCSGESLTWEDGTKQWLNFLKGLMPKVYSTTAYGYITNRYTQCFGNNFSFYNTIWGKKNLTKLHVHNVTCNGTCYMLMYCNPLSAQKSSER